MKEEIQIIPICKIRILNPRTRQRRLQSSIVESIRNVGLKKPIKVSLTSSKDGFYDLVYGQGRLEAMQELGHEEIPAIVVDISKADRLLMSLIENMARRFPRHADIILEIRRQHEAGETQAAIARKLGLSTTTVSGYLTLSQAGEERLLFAAIREQIPIGIAMDIAKTGDIESQRELLAAYQKKQLNQKSIRLIKRLIDQRRLLGKNLPYHSKKSDTSSDKLLRAFRKDAERKRAIVKKARICENRLLFIVGACRRLMADEDFCNLLRAERLTSMPEFLAEKLTPQLGNVA